MYYSVLIGAFTQQRVAEKRSKLAKAYGLDCIVVKDGYLYKCLVGLFTDIHSANLEMSKAKLAGFKFSVLTKSN